MRSLSIISLATVTMVLILFSTGNARADVIHTLDGRSIEGRIVAEATDTVTVQLPLGQVTIQRKDIKRIERRPTPREEYAHRRLALADEDLDGRLALAQFCRDKELIPEAAALASGVVSRSPAHRAARKLLADLDYHEQANGTWLSPDEYYPTIGWKQRRGRWVSPEEAAFHDARSERRQLRKRLEELEDQLKGKDSSIERAESEVERAQRRLLDAQGKLEYAAELIARLDARLPSLREAVRYAELRAAESRGLLGGFLASPPPLEESELARTLRLQRQAALQLAVASADSELRQARRELQQAQDEIAEVQAFQRQGPKVIADRTALVERTRAQLDTVRANSETAREELASLHRDLRELEAEIRSHRDAMRRGAAERSVEKRTRPSGQLEPLAPPAAGGKK